MFLHQGLKKELADHFFVVATHPIVFAVRLFHPSFLCNNVRSFFPFNRGRQHQKISADLVLWQGEAKKLAWSISFFNFSFFSWFFYFTCVKVFLKRTCIVILIFLRLMMDNRISAAVGLAKWLKRYFSLSLAVSLLPLPSGPLVKVRYGILLPSNFCRCYV